MKEIHFVASPTAIGKTPVAIGSSVPPCPIFFNKYSGDQRISRDNVDETNHPVLMFKNYS